MVARIRSFLDAHYFEAALGCFWLSFLLLPTAKGVNNVFYALVALPGLFLVARRWRALPWRDVGFLLFLIWLLYGAVVTIAAGRGANLVKDVVYVFLFYSVLILAVDVSWWRCETLRRVAFWLVLSYVLYSSLYLWLTGAYAFGERIIWLLARMEGPIYTSMFLVSLWALAAEDWLARKRYTEMLLAAALLLFCIVQGLQSRTGLLGFCAVVALLLARWRPRTSVWILAGLAALVTAYLGQAGGIDTLRTWSFVARGDSMRFEVWSKVLGELRECGMLFGCGYRYKIHSALAGYDVPIAHSHSVFIAQSLFGGLLGLSLLLAMTLWSLIHGWRTSGSWALCLAAGLIMLNFDGNNLIDNPDELWLLFHWPLAVLIALNANRGLAYEQAPSTPPLKL
jgi:hypothetical protein